MSIKSLGSELKRTSTTFIQQRVSQFEYGKN